MIKNAILNKSYFFKLYKYLKKYENYTIKANYDDI